MQVDKGKTSAFTAEGAGADTGKKGYFVEPVPLKLGYSPAALLDSKLFYRVYYKSFRFFYVLEVGELYRTQVYRKGKQGSSLEPF